MGGLTQCRRTSLTAGSRSPSEWFGGLCAVCIAYRGRMEGKGQRHAVAVYGKIMTELCSGRGYELAMMLLLAILYIGCCFKEVDVCLLIISTMNTSCKHLTLPLQSLATAPFCSLFSAILPNRFTRYEQQWCKGEKGSSHSCLCLSSCLFCCCYGSCCSAAVVPPSVAVKSPPPQQQLRILSASKT